MTTASERKAKAQLAAPIVEVNRQIEALMLKGLSHGAAHKKVMQDATIRNAYVIATNITHGRLKPATDYTRARS